MKLTKTLTLAAVVAAGLLAGTALQAQDAPKDKPPGAQGGPGSMHGRPNFDQLAKDLNLTEDQKTKLKAALDEQQTKMKALREDTSVAQADKRAKAKEIREATQAKIKEILTPEQLKKWQEHMQRNRPPGGEKPGAGGDKAPKKD